MRRTRSRAGRSTKGKNFIPKSLTNPMFDGPPRTFVKVYSHFAFAQASNTLYSVSSEATVHPNYSLPTGSSPSYTQNNLQGGTNTTYSAFRTIIVKRAIYRIRLDNHQGQQVIVSFMKIPWASGGALGSNYVYALSGKMDKSQIVSVTLSKTGATGDTKQIVLVVEPWRVEGFPSYDLYASNSAYYATNSLRGTSYTNLHTQSMAGDETTALNVGVEFNYDAEFEVELRNPNPTLLA